MPIVLPAPALLPRPPAGPPVVLAAARAPAGELGPVSPAVVARPGTVIPVTTRPPAIVVDAARAPSGPRSPEQPVASPAVGAVPTVPPPTVATVPGLAAPKLQAGVFLPQKDDQTRELASARPAGRVPLAPERATVAPQQVPAEPRRREMAQRQPMHHQGELREIHERHLAAVSDLPVGRMAPAPARPVATFSPVSSIAPPASPSYAPPAAASPRARDTSMRGDVFFDGTRVGRWMSEQMARDAGRPNTGPTGFDPRRNPAWPGAAVTW